MTTKQLKEKIAKMTFEEKVLELTQYNSHDILTAAEKVITGNAQGEGLSPEQYLKTGTMLNAPNGETVIKVRNKRTENNITEPIVVMHDVIHGYRTVYPIPLQMACSFDADLVEDCAEMAAIEAKYDGIDATFSPMADLARDARWGRVMESSGEDPYLSGEMAKAFIRGYHKGGIACCVKHFYGYGAAEAGMEYNSTEVSDHTLNEYYLKGYKACMDEKPEMVMSSFNAMNGVPALGNKKIFVDKLRDEWGFDGVLISDYSSVSEMINHGYCEDLKECAKVAIDAKLDIEMCSVAYAKHLKELVDEGKTTMEAVDEAVLRVLTLKEKLGLYENPDRFTDLKKRDSVTLSKDFRNLARKAAEESCVLLKNDGVLPLKKEQKVALIGPFSDEKDIFGNWGCRGKGSDCVSLKEGFENLLSHNVVCEKGCSYKLDESDFSGIDGAVKAAETADVLLLCIGESMWQSGEAQARADISLQKVQVELVKRAAALGKPVVLVVFGGRPLVLTEVSDYASAILYAWQPGVEGGNALANLLYGKVVPCGKTVMSFPRTTGQCPIYYNHYRTGRSKESEDTPYRAFLTGYLDYVNAPLFSFGHGLSYTTFEYSDLKLSATEFNKNQQLTATVKVKNTGDFDAKEVVQWYICDRFGSTVRPVKELKGYEKIFLKAGEETTLSFKVTEETLAFYTASGEYKAEAGKFYLYVGGSSKDCLQAEFELVD